MFYPQTRWQCGNLVKWFLNKRENITGGKSALKLTTLPFTPHPPFFYFLKSFSLCKSTILNQYTDIILIYVPQLLIWICCAAGWSSCCVNTIHSPKHINCHHVFTSILLLEHLLPRRKYDCGGIKAKGYSHKVGNKPQTWYHVNRLPQSKQNIPFLRCKSLSHKVITFWYHKTI